MAAFGETDLEIASGSGAVFETTSDSRDAFAYRLASGGEVVIPAQGRAVVVRGIRGNGPKEVMAEAREAANRALDMALLQRAAPTFLDHHKAPYVLWWSAGGTRTLRIVSLTNMLSRVSIGASVADQKDWDESLRYYRHSEATNDLFDSFRNLYLSLEALLSNEYPPRADAAGKLEREGAWLKRALREVGKRVDLSPFAPPGARAAHNAIHHELYVSLRTAIFHAKRGKAVWVPQDWSNRAVILEARQRYALFYRKLAHEFLDLRFGSSGMAQPFFEKTMEDLLPDQVFVSNDPTRPRAESEEYYEIAPAGGDFFTMSGSLASDMSGPGLRGVLGVASGSDIVSGIRDIRRFGSLHEGSVAFVDSLAEPLNVGGFERVEVVMLVGGRNHGAPRQDFDS